MLKVPWYTWWRSLYYRLLFFIFIIIVVYPFCFKGKPHSPIKLTVSDVEATQMRVSWTPPNFDGGSPITGYLVEYKDVSDSTKWAKVNVTISSGCTVVVQGLGENTKYQFRVYAENEVGLSAASKASNVNITLGTKFVYIFVVLSFVSLNKY